MADKVRAMTRKLADTPEMFAHRVIVWWLPLLYLLISSLFYLRTYDSAQVKISIMQMGGLALLMLWAIRLIEAGMKAFTKEDLVCLSPFLAYLLVGVFSFLHAPYNMASVDFFLRHVFFMTAALVVIYEFDGKASDRLTRILIWTAWIAIGYGFLQFIDMMLTVNGYFPQGIGKGLDPFIWRGAFGARIFSTYGNPNFFADFLVISLPIIVTQYLKTRRKSLIPLLVMLFLDLFATGTKGAWIGAAIVFAIFGVLAFRFFAETVKPFRKAVLTIVAVGVLGFLGVVGKDLGSRVVSVNFRLFTWEATWEMIMTHPIIGTGIGSFPPIYPAFRRPPIFHIEGKHNTETDHAEDEYLEQLFDNGILGFGIFIWLAYSTLFVGLKSLGQLTGPLRLKDGRPHPRAYDLMGYMVAFMGMLGHNLFDVSMRFVSSGVYLGLLSGMILNLARGQGLYEQHEQRNAGTPGEVAAAEAPGIWRTIAEFLIWPARLAGWGLIAWVGYRILVDFNYLQGPLERLNLGGEILQWWLAWLTLASCVLTLSWAFAKLVFMSENPLVPLVIAASVYPMQLFWGYFKADIHHNIAIFFSKERRWDEALSNYGVVHKLNPGFVMCSYFSGNVFNDRFNMDKVYNQNWGDVGGLPRDDYQRALDAYDEVRKLAPNYVQMHHQVGTLHLKRAEWSVNNGHPEQAQHYLDRAMERFRMYEALDPVFPANYYRIGQVYMIEKKYALAVKAYRDFINAEKCEVAPSLAAKPLLMRTLLSYQNYKNEPGVPHPVHRHETAEVYANLGNAYFMLENLNEAERAYLKALSLEPNNEQAKRNLTITYNKAQQLGRLKRLSTGGRAWKAGEIPVTGYEILPSKAK
jgi:tetratricopeptide (TPR) repeat protein/O-antigen ligase